MDRDEAIDRIRKALRERSGKTWSVKGGRGTAWGWIRIASPPAKQTTRHRLRPGQPDRPENYEPYDSGQPGGVMTVADREELARLLGLERVHDAGVSIPNSTDYYIEHIDRAEGRPPSVVGNPYWD
jgi:hypothetical protein